MRLGLLRQPPVVGEILVGLLLGSSVLHAALPKVGDWFFTRQVEVSLGMLSQLGLAIFMLLLDASSTWLRPAWAAGR
jgi:Kef-type K+ transport system membrane component KefB